MVQILSISRYIVAKNKTPVTNLGLQKLLFFVYGVCLSLKTPIQVSEKPQAWEYGPVFPSIYHRYKLYGSSPLPKELPLEDFPPDEKRITIVIDKVIFTFGSLKESILVRFTHEKGSPWAEVYSNGRNRLIKDESIKKYFKDHVIESA